MKTIQRQKMLLQDLTDRRKALKLQERELHKRQQQLIRREKDILSVGLILFTLGNASLQILIDYLEKKLVELPHTSLETMVHNIEERYLAHSEAELLAMSEGANVLNKRAYKEAKSFLAEHALYQWVLEQNMTKGLAPDSKLVWTKLSEITKADVHESCRDCGDEPLASSAADRQTRMPLRPGALKFVQRFRKRWALKRGSYPARDKVPLPLLRDKVCRSQYG